MCLRACVAGTGVNTRIFPRLEGVAAPGGHAQFHSEIYLCNPREVLTFEQRRMLCKFAYDCQLNKLVHAPRGETTA